MTGLKTDKAKLLKLFKLVGLSGYSILNNVDYIHGDAVTSGAKSCISLHDLDFNFDKDGKFIGTSNSSIKSFVPASKIKSLASKRAKK